jgi:hypothetical protein
MSAQSSTAKASGHWAPFYGLLVSPLSTPHWFVHLSNGQRLGRQDYDSDDTASTRLEL